MTVLERQNLHGEKIYSEKSPGTGDMSAHVMPRLVLTRVDKQRLSIEFKCC
jgi:hypothetical protein